MNFSDKMKYHCVFKVTLNAVIFIYTMIYSFIYSEMELNSQNIDKFSYYFQILYIIYLIITLIGCFFVLKFKSCLHNMRAVRSYFYLEIYMVIVSIVFICFKQSFVVFVSMTIFPMAFIFTLFKSNIFESIGNIFHIPLFILNIIMFSYTIMTPFFAISFFRGIILPEKK